MNKRTKTLIAGYGGLAREIAFYVTSDIRSKDIYDLAGYISEGSDDLGKVVGASKIMMTERDLSSLVEHYVVFLGSGSPLINSKIFNKLVDYKFLLFPSFISSSSTGDWKRCNMDMGNIITSGCAFTTDIKVGKFNLFNLNCTIGHDAAIGDYCVLNPSCNISGSTVIGSRVLVGTGAQVLQGISICDDVTIGAGAVVTKDITESGTYVGIPAKRIK